MKVADMTNDIVIHDATQQRWLYFHCPKRIISAHRIEEVIPAMKAVEWRRSGGSPGPGSGVSSISG